MEGDTDHRSTLGSDCSPHKHELQLVNIDTSGEQASSPTCPLNLLVPSKVDLELSDPFLSGGGGGAGDRTAPSSGYAVPTDQLVDFREKGSREADGSDRGDDGDLQLIADDALGMSGEADMDNIFQEALALADEFSELDKQDDADISLVDSAPQSLPGESELLSLDAALLAALAESRRELPPYRPRGLADAALDSSFPVPAAAPAPTPGPFTVSSLRSASAAAVAQAASAAASLLPPPPASSSLPGAEPDAPSPAPASAPSSAGGPHSSPRPAAPAAASPDRPGPAAAASSRLAGRRRAAPAAASPPASPPPAADRREASTAPPPPAAAGSAYADLCQQASAEQRELELQADEEYENRQFEQMERQVSRDEQDGPPAGDKSQPHPRSQLARKETYICRPNTGTFKIDKKQRFGTFKVDKTGTFKVPRQAASAARSLPPEPDPAPAPADGTNGRPEQEPEQEPEAEGPRASTPGRSVNGDLGVPSADSMNTYCDYADDEFGERSPSPSRAPLSASTPEREDAGRAAPRRPAGLRRPLTSTPCRSAGSSGSSIGVTPIRAPPAGSLTGPEDSPAPAPAAALRGAALRQPAGPGLRQPAAATTGLRKPAASGLRQPAASGLRQPAASGLRQPAASGLRQPAASGLRQPAASGLRQPAASGLRPPSASGLRAPSAAAAAPRSAPGRQTAAQLRQSSAQSGSDSSVCSVPGPNTSRSNPSLAADRSESEAPSLRQPRQLPGPSSRLPARGGVRRSAGGTGSLTNISLQASHTAPGGSRRPTTARNRAQETSKLSLSQQPAGSERF